MTRCLLAVARSTHQMSLSNFQDPLVVHAFFALPPTSRGVEVHSANALIIALKSYASPGGHPAWSCKPLISHLVFVAVTKEQGAAGEE